MTSCNPAIFDGLSGSINITQRGSLGSICEAYYHEDIIANILSVLAIRSKGHTLEHENESDSFFAAIHADNPFLLDVIMVSIDRKSVV